MSLHQCKHRGRAGVDRLEHPPKRGGVGDVRVVVEVGGGAHPLDVGAGAEALSLAAQHDRADGADIDERLERLGDQRRVERVSRLRPRQNDPKDVVVSLDP